MDSLIDGFDALISKARADLDALETAKAEVASSAPQTVAPKQRGRRPRKGGSRSDKTLRVIEENPGLTGMELAKEQGMKPSYLYRVLSDLRKEGKVKKTGRRYEAIPA